LIRRRFRRLLPGWVQETDLRLFRRFVSVHHPLLDDTLPGIGRAANKSRLWARIALILAAAGGRFGRRAAFRGLISIAVTSAFVNLPVKAAARRGRPPIKFVPEARRLARVPTSFSFPSGHSASAAAFATGAGIELPVMTGPLAVLAGAVAASRVYTGAHYPCDVLAGAAIGSAFALGSTRFWPMASKEPATAVRYLAPSAVEPSEDGAGLAVAVNPSAGSAVSRAPSERLEALLPKAKVIESDENSDVDELLRRVCEEGAVAIGVAGGDGSVNAAAEVASATGKPLLVVPAGTLNHLARDLGLDSVDQAVEAVKSGHTVAVDVGLIDGRPFLNTASFGKYVDIVDERYKLEGLIGKWPALLLALIKVFATSTPLKVEIDGRPRVIWVIFIGNCRYYPSGFAPSHRERLDDGLLDVRIVTAERRFSRARFVVSLLLGTLGRSKVYEERLTKKVDVRSLEGSLRLARDGETFEGSGKFIVEKSSTPIAVFVPHPAHE
jgi:diacylglycerol kinase family enzyme/membrane-associated phospholipid phosphatase